MVVHGLRKLTRTDGTEVVMSNSTEGLASPWRLRRSPLSMRYRRHGTKPVRRLVEAALLTGLLLLIAV